MGLLTAIRNFANPDATTQELVAEYRRLRQANFKLNNMLVRRLPKDVLNEGAKRLGILRNGVFDFNTEDEAAILMDYCIYDVRRNGRNAIEQYLAESPPADGSDELLCLRAMQQSTYGFVAVRATQRGMGCVVENLFNERQLLLVDIGLSKTAQTGSVIATRLLEFAKYHTTGGAAIPIAQLSEKQLDEWRQRFREGVFDDGTDPAPLIREALRRGASSCVRYASAEDNAVMNVQTATIRTNDPAAPKRELIERRTSKTAGKQRCRGGSGTMYKSCCGKG